MRYGEAKSYWKFGTFEPLVASRSNTTLTKNEVTKEYLESFYGFSKLLFESKLHYMDFIGI